MMGNMLGVNRQESGRAVGRTESAACTLASLMGWD